MIFSIRRFGQLSFVSSQPSRFLEFPLFSCHSVISSFFPHVDITPFDKELAIFRDLQL